MKLDYEDKNAVYVITYKVNSAFGGFRHTIYHGSYYNIPRYITELVGTSFDQIISVNLQKHSIISDNK